MSLTRSEHISIEKEILRPNDAEGLALSDADLALCLLIARRGNTALETVIDQHRTAMRDVATVRYLLRDKTKR